MSATAKNGGRRFTRVAGLLLTVACLTFVLERLLRHASELRAFSWGPGMVCALAGSSALVLAIATVQALAWRTLLRAVAPAATWRESFVLLGKSQLAKYLPGNVFHYVQRVALARGPAAGLTAAAAITLLDAILVATAAALVALPALPQAAALLVPLMDRAAPFPAVVLLLGLAAVLAVALWRRGRPFLDAVRTVASPRRIATSLSLDVAVFAIPGVMLSWLVGASWPGSAIGPHEFIPGFALAFLVGYLVPGSPGGVGVREAVLFGLFQQRMGSGLAAAVFLLARFAFVLGDLLTYVAARVLEESAAEGRVSP